MCIGTATGVGLAIAGVAGAGATVYAATRQAGSAHDAVTQQTTAANHAADLQSDSARDALNYTKEQAEIARRDADTTQHNNYNQWRAAQVYQNANAGSRARSINALGAQYGVAAREIPEMEIPDYVSTLEGAAAGPGGPPTAPAASASAGPGPGGDYRGWFMSQVAGKPVTQQTLLDLESSGALRQAGITLTPPNQAGERTKINVPGVGWVRVGFGEGDWVWTPQPASGGAASTSAPAAASAPGTVGAAMQGTTAAATPPINPALTVDPYERRTVRDYFAA